MWTSVLSEQAVAPLQWGGVLAASLVAAITDLRTGRIPNLLTGPLLLLGLLVAVCTAGWAGLGDAVLGALVLGGPFVLLFVFGGGGAGDAKMMAALGAWLGLAQGGMALVCVTVVGAVTGLAYALFRGRLRAVLRNLRLLVVHGLPGLAAGRAATASAEVASRSGSPGSDAAGALAPTANQMLAVPYGLAIFVGMCATAAGVLIWGR